MSDLQENWYNDPNDPGGMPRGDATSSNDAPQLGYPVSDSPEVPGRPVAGQASSPSGSKSRGLLIWGGAVAAVAVIAASALAVAIHHGGGSAAATLSAHPGHSSQPGPSDQSGQSGQSSGQPAQQSSGSGSTSDGSLTSQSQFCQSVVMPLQQQLSTGLMQTMPNTTNNALQQTVNDYRQAAQQASAYPQPAQDLSTAAVDLQKYDNDMTNMTVASAQNLQGDWDQFVQSAQAALNICTGF